MCRCRVRWCIHRVNFWWFTPNHEGHTFATCGHLCSGDACFLPPTECLRKTQRQHFRTRIIWCNEWAWRTICGATCPGSIPLCNRLCITPPAVCSHGLSPCYLQSCELSCTRGRVQAQRLKCPGVHCIPSALRRSAITHAQLRLCKRLFSLVVSIITLRDMILRPRTLMALAVAIGGLAGYVWLKVTATDKKSASPGALPGSRVNEAPFRQTASLSGWAVYAIFLLLLVPNRATHFSSCDAACAFQANVTGDRKCDAACAFQANVTGDSKMQVSPSGSLRGTTRGNRPVFVASPHHDWSASTSRRVKTHIHQEHWRETQTKKPGLNSS